MWFMSIQFWFNISFLSPKFWFYANVNWFYTGSIFICLVYYRFLVGSITDFLVLHWFHILFIWFNMGST